MSEQLQPHIAIACGGTGGHVFPGLAVARALVDRGCRITLIVSEKEVDRRAVDGVVDMKIVSFSSVGLVRGKRIAFALNLWKSLRHAKALFREDAPDAVLAMGGFTSAAPIIAGKKMGAACFLHESNTIPGRANRWLSRYADEVFVGFDSAGRRFRNVATRHTGTPVRPEFRPQEAAVARARMGLRPHDPVLLVMGGSQGASGINRLMIEALPGLAETFPLLQFIHLAGAQDLDPVQSVYHRLGVKAQVQLFCSQMNDALAAATLTVSRAGASSLAEVAAVRAPSVLIPYPAAADNHQYFNAKAFADSGAAVLLDQNTVSGSEFESLIVRLLSHHDELVAMKQQLTQHDAPWAASNIAEAVCASGSVRVKFPHPRREPGTGMSDSSSASLSSVESVMV